MIFYIKIVKKGKATYMFTLIHVNNKVKIIATTGTEYVTYLGIVRFCFFMHVYDYVFIDIASKHMPTDSFHFIIRNVIV